MITAKEARKLLKPNVYIGDHLEKIDIAIKTAASRGRWCEVEIVVRDDLCDIVYDLIVEHLNKLGYNIIGIYVVNKDKNKHIKFRISW